MLPAAFVPFPMHGFGMPDVGGVGGFEELQPVQMPFVVFPFPPDDPALPVEPVP